MSISVTKSSHATDISPSFGKEFIAQKLADYSEPMRKGTARGAKIGMKRNKYAAAIVLALYDLSSADVSKISSVPVRLISKWRTEPSFTVTIEKLRTEFCHTLVTDYACIQRYDLFDDCKLYCSKLKASIFEECDRLAAAQDDTLHRLWPLARRLF